MNPSPEDRPRPRFPWFGATTGALLLFGIVLVVLRFVFGLGFATNLDNATPWGLWTAFKLIFVALAASGYVMTAAVYLFGRHDYHALVRPAVLSGFLGYTLFILILLFDLGRSWRILFPFLVQPGTTSALFEIAICVALYYTTQFLELAPAGFEWLRWRRLRKLAVAATAGLTVLGVLLSMLHQSTLGALYLMVPSKLHVLWYSPNIPLHFFLSSIVGGVSMTMTIGWLCQRVYAERFAVDRDQLDRLTLGLAKAGALALAVYVSAKGVDLALEDKWAALHSPAGAWYLVELVGFGLAPAALLAIAHREGRPSLARMGAALAIVGIVMNRLNVAVLMFNRNLPADDRYVPSWMEYGVVIFLLALAVMIFRLVVRRMPILAAHPDFRQPQLP